MKKFLKITGISLLSLIALAFLIPVLFRKQVQSLVKKEINKQLNAKVDFKDLHISLFKHFPKITISIEGLSIVGKDIYQSDTLLSTRELDVTAGLFSVLRGKNIKVQAVYAHSPHIRLLVNRFGKPNWDIVKQAEISDSTGQSGPSAFQLSLKKYVISDGTLEYDDQQGNTKIALHQFDHSGSGNFTADVFTLSSSTRASSVNFIQDGIPYLFHTRTVMDADIKIDNQTNTYTFKTDDIQLNELQLSTEGFIQILNAETFKTDIEFSSPGNDFKKILSMVPAVYTKDFAGIKTTGEASFKGFVSGIFSPRQIPAYDIQLQVKNGSFQYPDLPKPVTNINLDLRALNTDGVPDHSIIDVSKGHLELDKEPFDFNFTYKNPYSTQYIAAGAKGKLDLAQLSRYIKLEEGTKLGGLIWADAFVKGPLKALETQKGSFSAGGFFDIRNFYFSNKQLSAPLQNGNIRMVISNEAALADQTKIDISSGHFEMGNEPVDFNLTLSKPVSDLIFAGKARGNLQLGHLQAFGLLPEGTKLSGLMKTDLGFRGSRAALQKKLYDQFFLDGQAAFTGVNYFSKEYPSGINIRNSTLDFKGRTLQLQNLDIRYLSSNITGNGQINNLTGYILSDEPLTGNLQLNADRVNLNEWMGNANINPAASPSGNQVRSGSAKAFLVPAEMDIRIQFKAGQLQYDQVQYNNINGYMRMSDERVLLENVGANALDGSLLINGSYSTKINKEQPDISLSYDIKDMNVQKAFYAYNSMQALMPIGKFLSGKLHSQLSLTGNLDGEMLPLLNSLTGKGNLLLLEGVLAKFAPLEKIAAILDIDRLKSISIKDIKNYIEFSNGKVLVKPFTVKVQDIEMEITGFHGFDQSLDYGIKMKVPRALIGAKGNTLINNLVAKANAAGVPVSPGEIVNLQLKLTGTMSRPDVAVNLKDMAGDVIKDLQQQALDFAKARADSLKIKTRDSLMLVKQQAEQKAKEKLAEKGIDTSGLHLNNMKDTVLERVKDTVKKRATDSLKRKLKGLLNKN